MPKLRDIRIAKGYTQMDLAVLSGVHITTISLIERDHCKQPKRETIWKLAGALGVLPAGIEIPIDEERRQEKAQRSLRIAQWFGRKSARGVIH